MKPLYDIKEHENFKFEYYDIEQTMKKYPDANCYVIFGGRRRGKTFSWFRMAYEKKIKFTYARRTKKEVSMMCAGCMSSSELNKYIERMEEEEYQEFLAKKEEKMLYNKRITRVSRNSSPWAKINPVLGCNVRPVKFTEGEVTVYECYDCDEHNIPIDCDNPVCSFITCEGARGYNFDDYDAMVVDEVVPPAGAFGNRNDEGLALLDTYTTINNHRELQGKPSMKLILMSNSDNINCPIITQLNLLEDLAKMEVAGVSEFYDEERRTCLVKLETSLDEIEYIDSKVWIAGFMKGTVWHKTNIENKFANNDFTKVQTMDLKNFRGVCKVHWNERDYYCYQRTTDDMIYVSRTPYTNKNLPEYNLDIDGDVISFTGNRNMMYSAIAKDLFRTEDFSFYNMIMKYDKTFRDKK